jgi:zinc transport system substrate-binding protein
MQGVCPKEEESMKPLYFLALLLIFPLFCFPSGIRQIDKRSRIAVSILPQKYFVQRIAGGKWNIDVMVPPGHNPAVYEPTPLQLQNLSRALIYFRIGYIGFELAWMGNLKQLNPAMTIVDTSRDVALIHGSGKNGHKSSGNETGIDPHIWLSPKAVAVIAGHISGTLEKADPENQAFYQANYHLFLSDIDRLDSEIRRIFSNKKKRKFMVFHPAWTYFARDYDLIQISIEKEGKDPAPSNLKQIIDEARHEGIHSIIVQSQFDTHSAETIGRALNGEVILLDPLALDWINNLKNIAVKINGLLR